jgi:hypothetical protein
MVNGKWQIKTLHAWNKTKCPRLASCVTDSCGRHSKVTALCRGASRSLLLNRCTEFHRFCATIRVSLQNANPRRPHGLSCSYKPYDLNFTYCEKRHGWGEPLCSSKRETPRHKAVASSESSNACAFCSSERETPRHKAVASSESSNACALCSSKRETPRRKAVASSETATVLSAANVRFQQKGGHTWPPFPLRTIAWRYSSIEISSRSSFCKTGSGSLPF